MGVSWQCCWLVGINSNKQNILKHYLLVKLWMVLLLSFLNDRLKLRVLFSEHIIHEFPSKKSNCSELRCIVAMDKNLEHKKKTTTFKTLAFQHMTLTNHLEINSQYNIYSNTNQGCSTWLSKDNQDQINHWGVFCLNFCGSVRKILVHIISNRFCTMAEWCFMFAPSKK